MIDTDGRSSPLGLRIFAGVLVAFLLIFAATAPWSLGGREIARWSAAVGAAVVAAAAALTVRPGWRRSLLHGLRREGLVLPRWAPLAGGLLAAAFFLRVVAARSAALETNAWDLTLFFDRPIAETLSGHPLYCDFIGRSYLGMHASFLMFAFVPFYAIVLTPFWLLAAQALSLAAAGIVAFFLFRRLGGDDLAAALLVAAFWSNTYTAKAAQYVFHIEIFYPLALFGLLAAFQARRRLLFAAALLLALSIKEDALLVIAGFALTAGLLFRRTVWAAAAFGAGLAVFLFDVRFVLPHFSGSPDPWYGFYWRSFGAMPFEAVGGMASHPAAFGKALASSGLFDLFEPLLFLPLAGPEWLAAALPALLAYSAADFAPLSHFLLYYSMPVLPFLFAATARALPRLTRLSKSTPPPEKQRLGHRLAAIVVLLVCALDGAGYRLDRPRPERNEIRPLLDRLPPGSSVLIQGALLPRAGYDRSRKPLEPGTPITPHDAVLVDPAVNPYPFQPLQLGALVARLKADPRLSLLRSAHGLMLFVPRRTSVR